MDTTARFRGSIVAMAVGDALGHPTEFLNIRNIRERYGPFGVTGLEPAGRHPAGTFTDDTQMAIAVARALVRAGHQPLDLLMEVLAEEFVVWSRAAENNRAPGGTCLQGCGNLARGTSWRRAGVAGSKGCGAAMRAAPIGLFFHHDDELLVRNAAAQSALTHRHPTGYTSSIAAAAAAAWACRGEPLDGLLDYTRAMVERFDEKLYAEMGGPSEDSAARGVREMVDLLERTRRALPRESDDVCELLGGAWVGEEAVACALWCVLRAEGDVRQALLRGANSSGDSDSIAAIAGSIVGAGGGLEAVPSDWVAKVERGEDLIALADALANSCAASPAHTSARGANLGPALQFFTARAQSSFWSPAPSTDESDDDDDTSPEAEDWPTEELQAEPSSATPAADTLSLADLATAGVETLAARIAHHNRRYWDDCDPEISDTTYDTLVRRLSELAPDHPVLTTMGPTMASIGTAVHHQQPMLSLDKCYSDSELERWLGTFAGDVVAMPKLDGVACTLHYDAAGVLRQAATRGDGARGDDITRNAWATATIPRRIATTQPLEVRGELYMRLSVFERFRAEGMANPRNLAAGAIKQKNPAGCASYELSFAAFDAFGHELGTLADVLDSLAGLGFAPIGHRVLAHEHAAEAYQSFAEERPRLDYEIDGVVFKANDIAEQRRLGETAHHPRYALAYKFQGESGTSILRAVEWSVARTGAITPVAVVDPVPLSGVSVSRASLHHCGLVAKLGLTLGAEVVLTRRGGVIPNLEQVVTPGDRLVEIPAACPSCAAPVRHDGDFLFCSEPTSCRQATIGRLGHFAGTTEMIGFGPSILEQCYDAGLLRSPADFYRLDATGLGRLERCGDKLAVKLLLEIERCRRLSLATFLRALGLPELGRHVSKLLADSYGDLDTVLALDAEALAAHHSIGATIASAVVGGLLGARPEVEALREHVTITSQEGGGEPASGDGPSADAAPAGALRGKSFVFTGTLTTLGRRAAARAVEERGGTIQESVSAELTYLVQGHSSSVSSKERAARAAIAAGAGLVILAEAEFLALLEASLGPVSDQSATSEAAETVETPTRAVQLPLF